MSVNPIIFNLTTLNLRSSEGGLILLSILPRSITVLLLLLLYMKVSDPSSSSLKLLYFIDGSSIFVPFSISSLSLALLNIMVNLSYIWFATSSSMSCPVTSAKFNASSLAASSRLLLYLILKSHASLHTLHWIILKCNVLWNVCTFSLPILVHEVVHRLGCWILTNICPVTGWYFHHWNLHFPLQMPLSWSACIHGFLPAIFISVQVIQLICVSGNRLFVLLLPDVGFSVHVVLPCFDFHWHLYSTLVLERKILCLFDLKVIIVWFYREVRCFDGNNLKLCYS